MATVKEILSYLEELAPPELKMDFDNVGLLVGDPAAPVGRVLTALDVTDEVIEEALSLGAELVVAHHPVFFELKSVLASDPAGRKVLALARGGVSAICMHTNLDAARGGVNDALAAALGLRVLGELNTREHISRVCELVSAKPLADFMDTVCAALNPGGLRYHDAGRPVRTVGVCGGSGGNDLTLAWERGCDTFLTADVKYHQFLLAKELGLNLIDAGHFPTENVIVPVLAESLAAGFPEVEVAVSSIHRQTEQFFVK